MTSEAMDAEFDTVAGWTADAALALGPDHAVPAACRGSGGPAALTWLIDRLGIRAGDRMLDCGAGVGGPATFAAERTGVEPVLAEPAVGACRAARRLFGSRVTATSGQRLPFADDSFDVVWSIAVLCTTDEQTELLREVRRVLVPHGRFGLLVYVRTVDDLRDGPEGNEFPNDDELGAMIAAAGFEVTARQDMHDLPDETEDWKRRATAVDDLLQRGHGDDERWRTAQANSEAFGALLADGRVQGRLFALRAS